MDDSLLPPVWSELVRRLQRELDFVALGTIVTDAWPYKGGLRIKLDIPNHLDASQRREVERLLDHAQTASRFLSA